MADPTVEIAYAIKFKGDFILQVQQQEARLLKTVRQDPDFLEGKYGYFDRIAPTADQQKATAHADTPILNSVYSRRRIIRDTRNWGDMVDRSQIERMMKNPTSKLVTNARMAVNRTRDDYIVAAATGNSYAIDKDDAATAIALPAGQIVGQGAGAVLGVSNVLKSQEILDANEVDDEEERWFVHKAHQVTQMLDTITTTSQYYLQIQQLRDGKIDYFAKASWVRSERLKNDPAHAGETMCLHYAQRGIGAAIQGDPFTRVTERGDKSYDWQIYLEHEVGAVRIEEECVVQVNAKNT